MTKRSCGPLAVCIPRTAKPRRLMKTLPNIVILFLLALGTFAQAQGRKDIDQDIPLARAISRANLEFRNEEPLTEEEVIAAIRDIKARHPDMEEAVRRVFERVAKERMLPKGMSFSHISGWETDTDYHHVDWQDLQLDYKAAGIKDAKKGAGFTFRIRNVILSSRPLSEEEKKARQR